MKLFIYSYKTIRHKVYRRRNYPVKLHDYVLVALYPFYYALHSGEGAGGDGYALADVVVDVFAGLEIEDLVAGDLGHLHEIVHGGIADGHYLMKGVVGGVVHDITLGSVVAVEMLHVVDGFLSGTDEHEICYCGDEFPYSLTLAFYYFVFHWNEILHTIFVEMLFHQHFPSVGNSHGEPILFSRIYHFLD